MNSFTRRSHLRANVLGGRVDLDPDLCDPGSEHLWWLNLLGLFF